MGPKDTANGRVRRFLRTLRDSDLGIVYLAGLPPVPVICAIQISAGADPGWLYVLIWLSVSIGVIIPAIDETFNATAEGDPFRLISKWWRLSLAYVLAANGVAMLIVSKGVANDDWWQGLWMELGAALLLGAIVDLLIEIRKPTADPTTSNQSIAAGRPSRGDTPTDATS